MSFFAELKRRNVVRVGMAYAVTAWLVLQLGDIIADNFSVPDWTMSAILLALVCGFPIALVFAWAFELTPEGVKREKDVDRSQSITQKTGRKLDRAIIVILVLALGYFVFDKFSPVTDEPASQPVATTDMDEPGTVSSGDGPRDRNRGHSREFHRGAAVREHVQRPGPGILFPMAFPRNC